MTTTPKKRFRRLHFVVAALKIQIYRFKIQACTQYAQRKSNELRKNIEKTFTAWKYMYHRSLNSLVWNPTNSKTERLKKLKLKMRWYSTIPVVDVQIRGMTRAMSLFWFYCQINQNKLMHAAACYFRAEHFGAEQNSGISPNF